VRATISYSSSVQTACAWRVDAADEGSAFFRRDKGLLRHAAFELRFWRERKKARSVQQSCKPGKFSAEDGS
jgi:hypothetical protein